MALLAIASPSLYRTPAPPGEARPRRAHPRVAVVYPISFGAAGIYGGGERYALELAKALARRVPTRLIDFADGARRSQEDGLEIHTYAPRRHVHGHPLNPLSFGFLRSLLGVDVVHCLTWNTLVTDFSILAAKVTGKKVFVTDVGGGASLTLNRRLPLARWVDRFLLIVPQGGAQFETHRDRWTIILAGVDTETYRPAPDVSRRGVLFVGRLLPHKGINYLIEAVGPETPLTLAGRPYHDEYFALLRRLSVGKDVTFRLDASDEEIVALYRTSAVSVLPSVNETIYGDRFDLPELLGFAAMEAMACGTPVICSRVGGLGELVVDGVTGFLVPPNDPVALRARILELTGDPARAAAMGAAARARILETFTWDQVAERCLEAYGGAEGER